MCIRDSRKVNDRPSGRSVLGHVGVGKLMVFLDVLVIGLLALPPDHPRPDDKREANHQKDDGSHHEAAPLLFGRLGGLGCRTVPIGRRDGPPTVAYRLVGLGVTGLVIGNEMCIRDRATKAHTTSRWYERCRIVPPSESVATL